MIYLIIVFGLIADQVTKYWAYSSLRGSNPIVLVNNWLDFTYVENTGVAFGSFSGYKYVFLFLSITAFFVINYYVYKNKNSLPLLEKVLFIFISCGALSNALDRITYSFVVDFIHTGLGGLYDFPVFNLADIYITVSCITLIVISFRKKEISDESKL